MSGASYVALFTRVETFWAAMAVLSYGVRTASISLCAIPSADSQTSARPWSSSMVEIDYQRLAEIQEEILWLCEAANVPVIWATEVLDRFIKNGRPSRAEFTDAAASERADCVMLNKGPFIVEAVRVLGDVLRRMEAHQAKNTHLLRALKSWSQNPTP